MRKKKTHTQSRPRRVPRPDPKTLSNLFFMDEFSRGPFKPKAALVIGVDERGETIMAVDFTCPPTYLVSMMGKATTQLLRELGVTEAQLTAFVERIRPDAEEIAEGVPDEKPKVH